MHHSGCDDGEARLVGGASDSEGTVEVCLGNLWGLVAESGWSLADAQVVCHQLGFPLDGKGLQLFLQHLKMEMDYRFDTIIT